MNFGQPGTIGTEPFPSLDEGKTFAERIARGPLTVVDETWIAGSTARVQSLDLSDLEPGTYFWRVFTLDADGYESAWPHTAHFIYPMALR